MTSTLKIRTFPDPVLRKISPLVTGFDAALMQFLKTLEDTMRSQAGGVGIAAPQVGVLKQIAIVDVSSKVPHAGRLILINPVLLDRSHENIHREGCMSLPHFTANVSRASKIKLRWQDETAKLCERVFEGFQAVCIQHELDHLNGMLIVDRVACLNTDVFRRKKYL